MTPQPPFTLQWGINGRYEKFVFSDPAEIPFLADCIVNAAKTNPFTFAIADAKNQIVKQGSGNLPQYP